MFLTRTGKVYACAFYTYEDELYWCGRFRSEVIDKPQFVVSPLYVDVYPELAHLRQSILNHTKNKINNSWFHKEECKRYGRNRDIVSADVYQILVKLDDALQKGKYSMKNGRRGGSA